MCYHLQSIYNKDAMFPTVDATYVIHLKGNGRYNDVKEQLDQYPFTKVVHILSNEGFKKCSKPNIKSSVQDIIDANLYCMKHAKRQQYDNILIIEDDFIVDHQIHKHTDNINNFVKTHEKKEFIYRLGCIPGIMIPYDSNNYRGHSGGSHAVIYSKKMCNTILKIKQEKINDWDEYINIYYVPYIYYTPIVYQLFPETENKSKWGSTGNMYTKIIVYFNHIIIYVLQLDKQIEPGYSIMYIFAKLWWIVFLILLFVLLFFYRIQNNK